MEQKSMQQTESRLHEVCVRITVQCRNWPDAEKEKRKNTKSGRVAPLAPASRTVNPSWPSNSPITGEAILNCMPRNHSALITYWKLVDLLEYLIDILPLFSVYVCTKDFELCLHHNWTFQLQFYTLGNLYLVQFTQITCKANVSRYLSIMLWRHMGGPYVKLHTLLTSTLHGEGVQLHATANIQQYSFVDEAGLVPEPVCARYQREKSILPVIQNLDWHWTKTSLLITSTTTGFKLKQHTQTLECTEKSWLAVEPISNSGRWSAIMSDESWSFPQYLRMIAGISFNKLWKNNSGLFVLLQLLNFKKLCISPKDLGLKVRWV